MLNRLQVAARYLLFTTSGSNLRLRSESPLPFYVKDKVSNCQTCHMETRSDSTSGLWREAGKLASHRWLGANTLLSKYYGYDEQMDKTIAFLRNKRLNVDIFGIERNGGKVDCAAWAAKL